jgi:hypothetical protein
VRVIVNSGVGRHFHTGADVVEIATDDLGSSATASPCSTWDMGSGSSDANAAVAARPTPSTVGQQPATHTFARGPSRPPNPAAPTRRSPSKRPSPPGWCSKARCGSTLACRRCDGQAASATNRLGPPSRECVPEALALSAATVSVAPVGTGVVPGVETTRATSSSISEPTLKAVVSKLFHAHRRLARAATRHRRPASPPARAAGTRPPGRPGPRGSAG